jgi:hypothetical protein
VSQATERVERLRSRALGKIEIICPEQELLWARAWLASANEPWYIIRRAKAIAAVLSGLTPVIDEDELVVGKYCPRPLTDSEKEELARWHATGAKAVPPAWGQKAHMSIDYEKLLRLGLQGVRGQIHTYRARLELSDPADLEKDAFYRACLLTLDGVEACAVHYAELAEQLAAEAASPRREELLNIAAMCRRVPLMPTQSFREAIQAVHFITFCLCAGQLLSLFQLGRPDRYLWPYYRRDLEAG